MATSHLSYYRQHQISPVRYSFSSEAEHFERRDALYRCLGLAPVAFKGCRVLEVAPGSGQNSLYVACRMPSELHLVEPNPSGLLDIARTYESVPATRHTKPTIHPVTLEDFAPSETAFDIVICENWLGSLPHEIGLLRKLASFLAPGGILVTTVVPYTGFFPNILRRLFADRLVDHSAPFDRQVESLVAVFGPHLSAMPKMTRGHADWVKDCMLNPHYLNVVLSLEDVLKAIGTEVEIAGTFPRFLSDWRWFKGLVGNDRRYNEMFLTAYFENIHNFLDQRQEAGPRSIEVNIALETACRAFHAAAHRFDTRWQEDGNPPRAMFGDVADTLVAIRDTLDEADAVVARAIDEAVDIWSRTDWGPATVRDMPNFRGLFGRETVYVGYTKPIS